MPAVEAGARLSRIEAWFSARGPWQRQGLALIAGSVATLGHPPFQLPLFFVAAIVVLVWLLDAAARGKRRFSAAFAAGWWFGLGHFASGMHWIAAAFQVESDVWGPLWGVPATLALAGGLALFWGAGAALAMAFWTGDVRRVPVFAACMFCTEWLRGNILTGLPWLLPGYVWAPGEPLSQLASLLGAYGLTLFTLFIAAAPAAIADGRFTSGWRFAPVLFAALVIGLAWGWGEQRLAHAKIDPPGALPIVRVADSGLSQAEKWTPRADQEWRVLRRYLEASEAPEQSRAAVVIWPEGAIPVVNFFMLENPDFMAALGRGLGDRVLVTGLTRRELREDGVVYFNSAAVIDGVSGVARLSQTYDKHHLVPFGEYIPFWSLVSELSIAPLQRIGAGFEPGPPPTRLVVPGAPEAVVLICYEAIFPGMTPHGAERPGWIISVTNDAWFGGAAGPAQHFAMARYRAIEEGLPLARAASGGISGIVDAYGRAVRSTQEGGNHAEVQLPPALVETPWVRYGNVMVVAALMLAFALRFVPLNFVAPGIRTHE